MMTKIPTKYIEREFRQPKDQYYPNVFWFLNGEINQKTMGKQLVEMRAKGVFQPVIMPWEGLTCRYPSNEWFEIVKSACEKIRELGMTMLLYDELNWPSGYAGGEVLTVLPESRSKCLSIRETELDGPLEYRVSVTQRCLQAVVAAKIDSDLRLTDLTDLTGKMKGRELDCRLPPGRWKLMFFSIEEGNYQPPFSKSYYPDLLDSRAVAKFVELSHERYYEKMREHFGPVIKGIFTDEPGMYFNVWWFNPKSVPWTSSFLDIFRKEKTYSLRKYLPALWYPLKSERLATKIRVDFFDVLGSLYQKSYFKTIHDWCSRHNISLMGHVLSEEDLRFITRLEADYFKAMRYVEIPGVDNIGDWGKKAITPKLGSSVAHAFRRQVAFSETFALFGWSLTLEKMKAVTDWQFVRGINKQLISAFFYSVKGKRKHCVPPSIFQNVFWRYFRNYSDYTARLSYLLTQGRHVAPVAVLFPTTTMQATITALDLSEASRLQSLIETVSNLLLENQYDFDYVDESFFGRAKIKKSDSRTLLQLGDEAFSALVLPGNRIMSRKTLRKVKQFGEAGGTVIAIQHTPTKFPDGSSIDPSIEDVFPVFEVAHLPDILRDLRDVEILNPEAKEFEICDELIRGGVVSEGYVAWLKQGHEIGLLFEVDADCFDSAGCDVVVRESSAAKGYGPKNLPGDRGPKATLTLRKDSPSGKILASKTFEEIKPSRLTLEFEPLPKGRYYLQLEGERGDVGWWSRDFNEDNRTVAYADKRQVPGHDRLLYVGQRSRTTKTPFLNYLHVTRKNQHVYFITNSAPFDVDLKVAFRVEGVPELWDPETGNKNALHEFRHEDHRTVARLRLSKFGSAFFVFSKGKDVPHVTATNMWINSASLWKRSILVNSTAFRSGENFVEVEWGERKYRSVVNARARQTIVINEWDFRAPGFKGKLGTDWTQVLPFFSGTGVYAKTLLVRGSMLKNTKLLLECSNVAEIMELEINRRQVGIRCWSPYRFDITKYLKAGRNRIVVRVTNTSANAFDRTPTPSGLLAPVQIHAYENHLLRMKIERS